MSNDRARATFEIDLEDGVSGPAANAASSMRKLDDAIKRDRKELAELKRAHRELKAAGLGEGAEAKRYAAAIEAKTKAIAEARAAYLGLGGPLVATTRSASRGADAHRGLADVVSGMPGPIGQLSASLAKMQGFLRENRALLLRGALLALGAATAYATGKMLAYGVASQDARRSELLRLEGLVKIRSWMGFATGSATVLQEAIDRAASSTALGRDELYRYAEQLHRSGLRGAALGEALEGVGIVASTQGQEMASQYAGMASMLNLTGGSVSKLAERIRSRIGGIAGKQLLSLDVQARKLREDFGALFRGVNIEPFLIGLRSLTSLFSQSTASGRALKTMASLIFTPLLGAVTSLAPIVKRFFQGMILGAQQVAIAVLTVVVSAKRLARDLGLSAPAIDGARLALWAGATTALLAAGAFAALAVSVVAATWPFLAGAAAVVALGAAMLKVYDWAMAMDWSAVGTSIVEGMVNGIKRGVRWVRDAMVSLAGAAKGAFKSALGIASPSKEFAKFGREIPRGVERGVNAGAGDAQGAVGGMISVPVGRDKPGGSRGNVTITVGDINVKASGGDAQAIAASIRLEVERIFEGLAVQMGAM